MFLSLIDTLTANCVVQLICYISRSCTSIVAQDSLGQIWHARNLDFTFTDYLKNLTIGVHFTRNGTVGWRMHSWAVSELFY